MKPTQRLSDLTKLKVSTLMRAGDSHKAYQPFIDAAAKAIEPSGEWCMGDWIDFTDETSHSDLTVAEFVQSNDIKDAEISP